MSLSKLVVSAFTAIVLFVGCATTTEGDASKSELSANDQALLNYAVELQSQFAKQVWPGFENFKTTVVFFTSQGQFLFNPPKNPPEEYNAVSSQGIKWSSQNFKSSEWKGAEGQPVTQAEIDKAYIANAYSSEQTGKHFPFSVFFLDSLERFHAKGMKWSSDEWLSIFWHEVFHNYQDTLYKASLVTPTVTDFANVKSYVESKSFLNQVREEQRLLIRALKHKNLIRKKLLVCGDYLKARRNRYSTMKPNAVASENFYEASEGTARYVEEMMSLTAGKYLSVDSNRSTTSIPDFKNFSKYAGKSVQSFYGKLDRISTGDRYFYNTGFGLALLLDQVEPGWKRDVFRKKGFLYGKIETWCYQ